MPGQASRTNAGTLLRILGVSFGLAVIVGSTIGVGILRTPGAVAAQLGSRPLILTVWLLGGLYTLLGSICFTELGTMLPQAGGYYVYARRAFGDRVGFAAGWTDWLTYCSVLGYVAIATGEFATALFPSPAGRGSVTGIAVVTLLFFAGLQWLGLRASSRTQEVTSLLKFVAFLGLVLACFRHGRVPDAAFPPPAGAGTFFAIVIALQSVVITYGGWQSALYFTEEDRNPARNLPRSMVGGVLLTFAIYMLVNLAFLRVLPLPSLAASKLPAADAAQAIFGARGGEIITLLSLLSLLPLVNAILMIGTRVVFALGRDGLVSTRVASVNAGGTPGVAMLATTALAIGLAASGTFEKLVALASFFLAANYCVCCIALVVLRRREPETARPFRAWGYPWSVLIVLVGAVIFLLGFVLGDTRNSLYALALMGLGAVYQFVGPHPRHR